MRRAQARVACSAGSGPSKRSAVVTASRATVVFNEDFQPLSRGLNEDDQLRRVKTIHAWGRDDLPSVITRPGYRAEADEATWVAERQELRLFGEGQQRFHRGADDTLVASEITYLRDRGLIQLRRDVRGQIRLAHRSSLDPGKALLSSDDPGDKARGPERADAEHRDDVYTQRPSEQRAAQGATSARPRPT